MVSQGVRTHTCGELRRSHVGQSVALSGWVNSCREMGGALVFVDLRDKYGITQLAFDDSVQAGLRERARAPKTESTIHMRGVVRPRPEGQANIAQNRVLMLVDLGEDPTRVDAQRVREARDRAISRLRTPAEDVDYARAEAALRRALARLRYGGEPEA